ncbi:hypothetical protein BHE74_00044004 [Ensete ventricosum]|nr:hypothetical protein BHE74_00044004 [Ensete ventricosum]RZS18429.1 hypothetical protein BHM03_00050692 [Ensete ventricosum]
MVETYGGRAAAVAWDKGMGRHAALMCMSQSGSCSGTSTSDSRSDPDLVPRANVASSEVLLTSGLAEIRDSSKRLVGWLRYATQAKDRWTGRDTQLGQRTEGLTEIRDSGQGLRD